MRKKQEKRKFEGGRAWIIWNGPLMNTLNRVKPRFWDDELLTQEQQKEIMWYVGVEVHKLRIVYALFGRLREQRILGPIWSADNTPEGWWEIIPKLGQFTPFRFLAETTGIFHFTPYWNLTAAFPKSQVIIMNSTRISNIITGVRKNDKSDATRLAQLASFDELLQPSYVPDKETALLREACRQRTRLVRECTRTKNRIKKLLDMHGIGWGLKFDNKKHREVMAVFLEQGGTLGEAVMKLEENKGKRKKKTKRAKTTTRRSTSYDKIALSLRHWEKCELPHTMSQVLMDEMKLLEIREFERDLCERRVLDLVELRPDIKEDLALLDSVPGLQYYSRIELLSEIGDISRFKTAKRLLSYSGIGPAGKTSGVEHVGDTVEKVVSPDVPNKFCNRRLKLLWLLAGRTTYRVSAQKADTDLLRYAVHIRNKNITALKAHFKIAAKLARNIFTCLTTKQPFNAYVEQEGVTVRGQKEQKRFETRQKKEKTWENTRMKLSWEMILDTFRELGIKHGLMERFQNLLIRRYGPKIGKMKS